MPIDNDLIRSKRTERKGEAAEIAAIWMNREAIHKQLFVRWTREYILQLTKAQKWQRAGFEPKKGEFVLVELDKTKQPSRMHWPIAIIEEVYPSSRDGRTRAVLLRLGGNKSCKEGCQHQKADACHAKPHLMRRDARHIFRLEMSDPPAQGN
jgi:hypothetical protein